MAEIVPFTRRRGRGKNIPTFEKIVDGEVIECVDVDALSPEQRAEFFRENDESTPPSRNMKERRDESEID